MHTGERGGTMGAETNQFALVRSSAAGYKDFPVAVAAVVSLCKSIITVRPSADPSERGAHSKAGHSICQVGKSGPSPAQRCGLAIVV